MKVAAFSGSARKDANTPILIRQVFTEFEKNGIKTELVQLAGKLVRGCTVCYRCFGTKDQRCALLTMTRLTPA